MNTKIRLFEMTRPEIEAAMARGMTTAVMTFGSTEQHGLHLPMGTDSIWGEALGERVAIALGDALLLPGLRIGRSEHHLDFTGSLTLTETTFNLVVADVCRTLARHGFEHIVLLPTHGGNFAPLGIAADLVRPELPAVNIIAYSDMVTFIECLWSAAGKYGFSPSHSGSHAGENETSMILALRPELVDLESAEAGYTGDMLSLSDRIIGDGIKSITENGVLGDPAGARADIGEAYLEALTQLFVDFVRAEKETTK